MSLWLSGIGVSRGIAIGHVHRVQAADLEIPEYAVAPAALEREVARFQAALATGKRQLETIRAQIPEHAPAEVGAFLETHLLMLQDSTLSEAVANLIHEHRCNAEWALKLQQDHLIEAFEQMDDSYLRARRDDVAHVTARIHRVLLKEERQIDTRQHKASEPPVIVADDLTPADIILLHQQGVAAFVSAHGGPLSHSAILARSLRIPTIVGLHAARGMLEDKEVIIVDGEAGHVLAAPSAGAKKFYRNRQKRDRRHRRKLGKLRRAPATTIDGVAIRLHANVELPNDGAEATRMGAEGVGLYRTEFLYMNRGNMPTEQEQLAAYRQILSLVDGPVTIRTLDLGADKAASDILEQPISSNPALGLRAIRLCLRETDMFRTQLRALLRASAEGDLRIMLPMISNALELRQTRGLIAEIMAGLRSEGIAFNPSVQVGAMIEVPAAALSAPLLAHHADFFSLGTNDLTQYTLAMDRVDDEVNYLYDPLHPAVLQLIHSTITAGAAAGIPVGMCGEMASDRRYTRLLLGLGLTEFSMHPANILEVKQLITQSDTRILRARIRRVLAAPSTEAYQQLLHTLDDVS